MSGFRNSLKRRITWGDLDALGIVFYPRFYEWMDEASHIFFDKIGLNLVRLLREKGIIFALAETGARYIRPARYHDDIEIISYVKDIDDKTVTMYHEIRSLSEGGLLVEGYEKRICIRLISEGRFKSVSIPKSIKEIINNHRQ